ncbi:hypothetical protein D3C72_852650 [compost metagenome]
MRIRIALEGQQRVFRAVAMADEPDLAGAAMHLVFGRALVLRQVGQRFAEFDDITIAVLPVVEESEIVKDRFERGHLRAVSSVIAGLC